MPLPGRARPLALFALRAGGLAALLSSCAPRALPLTPEHPAHPDAEPGRLAGPPPALRPGIVQLESPAANAPASSEPAPASPQTPAQGSHTDSQRDSRRESNPASHPGSHPASHQGRH